MILWMKMACVPLATYKNRETYCEQWSQKIPKQIPGNSFDFMQKILNIVHVLHLISIEWLKYFLFYVAFRFPLADSVLSAILLDRCQHATFYLLIWFAVTKLSYKSFHWIFENDEKKRQSNVQHKINGIGLGLNPAQRKPTDINCFNWAYIFWQSNEYKSLSYKKQLPARHLSFKLQKNAKITAQSLAISIEMLLFSRISCSRYTDAETYSEFFPKSNEFWIYRLARNRTEYGFKLHFPWDEISNFSWCFSENFT